jgi:hypothetical protein
VGANDDKKKRIYSSRATTLNCSVAELKITNTITRYDASGNRTLMPVDHSETRGLPLICSSGVTYQLL